jgi:group II intron reverse transcriptase/maturase
VRRVLVPKREDGLRRLAIWTLRDRIAQRAVHDYLEPIAERLFLDCSYGFRPGRSVGDAVAAVIGHRDAGRRWVVDADIRDCFGSMDTGLLRRMVRQVVPERAVVQLIDRWLEARIFNPLQGRRARAGTSQGGVISPLLCNLYLHHFDVALTRRGLHLVRFADDFVILCRRRWQSRRALVAARTALTRLRLELNPQKTRLVHFGEGFAFLGFFFLRQEHFCL